MKKLFTDGDIFTYRLLNPYGSYVFIEKSENKNILLYYKVGSQQSNDDVSFVIIIPKQFVGIENVTRKDSWRSKNYFYSKPFDYTFKFNEKYKALALMYELDDESNLERKKSIDEWRVVYESERIFSIPDDKFWRYKVDYYKYKLPLLKKVPMEKGKLYCFKCLGYGVIPQYFGINVKTGYCYKCQGTGLLDN